MHTLHVMKASVLHPLSEPHQDALSVKLSLSFIFQVIHAHSGPAVRIVFAAGSAVGMAFAAGRTAGAAAGGLPASSPAFAGTILLPSSVRVVSTL